MISVGQGFDIHRFSDDPERPLILGGVTIPGAPGLAGHSDADVVTHALIDALLSAAGLGDIGDHFADTDPAHEGISSQVMLAATLAKLGEAQRRVASASVTVIAETPKLANLKATIASELTEAVGAPVSLTATTMEGLGPIGSREAIAALAVALVESA
jgi:2-C-methyl-D-erythritol 2,4-cyclodiphosphate synthase